MFKAIQKSKSKKGFTLVELIVVISIIAILLLILVPSLLAYLAKARKTKAEANAKTAYNACVAVYTDLSTAGATPEITDLPSYAIASGLIDSDWDVVVTPGDDSGANAIAYVTWRVTEGASAEGDWATWPSQEKSNQGESNQGN